jgi:hypothetical protein
MWPSRLDRRAAEVKDGETIQSLPPLQMADMLKKASGILDSSQQAIKNATLGHGASELGKRQDRFGQGTVARW